MLDRPGDKHMRKFQILAFTILLADYNKTTIVNDLFNRNSFERICGKYLSRKYSLPKSMLDLKVSTAIHPKFTQM